jgi:signal transduction histidine kinase/CheY-like chemotaxis protein/HPt (histidine-containing phosphotransfer) domain-containing protein
VSALFRHGGGLAGINVFVFVSVLLGCTLLTDVSDALSGLGYILLALSIVRLAVSQRRSAARSKALEQALAHMSQGMVCVDDRGAMVVMNRRAGEMLGLPEKFVDTCASYPEVITHQIGTGEYDAADPKVQEFVKSGAWSVEFGTYERTRPNGTVLEVHSVPLGKKSFVRTYLDVTERKNAALELAKAKDKAEEDGRAKETFFAMMSHEMRTPLNGVIGLADVLADSKLGPAARQHVRILQDSANDLLQIINDLLDFSKMRSENAFQLESTTFDLERIVSGAVGTLTSIAQRKGLQIISEIEPDLPRRLVGDGSRLKQVLLNLIGNAIKFTGVGHVRVSVSALRKTGADVDLRVQIDDTGIGIAAESMSKLFKAFSQVDASISRRYGGTGLGLAISQKIVEAMGSRIEVRSVEGQGSSFEFTVRLPRDVGPASATERAESFKAVGSKRILLAEDNETNCLVATTLLEKMGHVVEVARNGIEAVEAASEKAYDLILMDVMMPEMDGLAATRAIRALPGAMSQVAIVALTANTLSGHVEAIMAAGMDAAVSKPITRLRLEQAVAKAVRSSGPAGIAVDVVPQSAAVMEGLPVIDRPVLDGLRSEVGEADAERMLDVFMRNAQQSIRGLAKLDKDGAALERAAHSLKSSAGIFGFARLSRLAADLEQDARRIENPEQSISCLAAALDETRRFIEAA